MTRDERLDRLHRRNILNALDDAISSSGLAAKNVAKGNGWRKEALALHLRRLRDEVDELAEAVLSGAPDEQVRAETGDVAWAAAIVADAVGAWGDTRLCEVKRLPTWSRVVSCVLAEGHEGPHQDPAGIRWDGGEPP